ncbi:MAG: nitrogenase molybdenum-cofactor synthesis protein NifE, partial [Actinomycetota bacterium]|nr:nitrogenase molybdenum-cofactor synthesis protein NifE [Actinomycetota bacterium]
MTPQEGTGDAQDDENCSGGHSARRPSCPQPTPGAAAGGCAYDGSAITLVPVADVAHLVHGPIGCLGNSWETRGSLSSGSTLHRRAFTTKLGEHDVIFGGEGTLRDAILDIGRRFQPPAVFVYLTCVPGLIGDDVEAVCRHAAAELGLPVVPVLAAGFSGTKNAGNRLGGSALLTHVIGTAEPAHTTPYDVNLIGGYNIAGELWQVLPLLDRLGIRVLSKISGDARYAELTWAHRAKASMVV